MPAKTTCVLVAILFCFSATAAVNPSLTPEQKKLARDAREVLGTYCGNCHGKAGSFNDEMLIDHALLKQEKFFIPGKPNESPLYTIIFDEKKHASKKGDKKMPPHEDRGKSNGKVPQNKLDIIKEWIDAGAPPWDIKPVPPDPPITHLQMLKWMAEDLKKLGPADRKDTRYFTLTHLHNAGELSYDMDDYRTALSKLVNSLSWEPEIINPQAIEHGNETILRISLADYQWDREIWEKISRDEPQPYPYNINFAGNQDRDYLIRETGAAFPFVRADWFIANAAKPELYHEILKLPDTDLKLENDKLHMTKNEVANNIGDGVSRRFMRSGFLVSGVSKFNRVVERHKKGRGAYWKSYDFSSNMGKKNVFRFPLGPKKFFPDGIDKREEELFQKGFQQDGGEIIFTLPNGLHGYFLVDDKGGRLDRAPINIVRNLNPGPGNDPQISNGLSCMTCHTRGIKALPLRAGDLRRAIEKADAGKVARNFDKKRALNLYSKAEEINKQVEEDAENFMKAVRDTGGVVGNREPIALLATHYESPLDKYLAAGELGVTVQVLEKAINQSRDLQEFGLFVLLGEDSPGLARQSWEMNYNKIYNRVHTPIGAFPVDFPLTLEASINPIKQHSPVISALAWSPDDPKGKTIVSTGLAKDMTRTTLLKWDAVFWEPTRGNPPVVEPRNFGNSEKLGGPTSLAFNPKEPDKLAVLSRDRGTRAPSLKIFDVDTPRQPLLKITLKEEDAAAFKRVKEAAEGLLAKYTKRGIRVFNADAKLKKEFLDGFKRSLSVSYFAWSPDGKKIAVSGFSTRDSYLAMQGDASFQGLLQNIHQQLNLKRAKHSDYEKKYLVLIVDSLTGEEIARRNFDQGAPGSLDWSPDGDMLAIHTPRGGFEIWDAEDDENKIGKHIFQEANSPLAVFSPLAVLGGETGKMSKLDWAPRNHQNKIKNKFTSSIAVGIGGGGFKIVRIGIDGVDVNGRKKVIKEGLTVNMAHVNPIKNIRGGVGAISIHFAWSADGRRLATGSGGLAGNFPGHRGKKPGEIKIWDTERLVDEKQKIDGKGRLITPVPNKPIQVIPIEPIEIFHLGQKFFRNAAVTSLAWHTKGKMIAAGLEDGTIRVFSDILQ